VVLARRPRALETGVLPAGSRGRAPVRGLGRNICLNRYQILSVYGRKLNEFDSTHSNSNILTRGCRGGRKTCHRPTVTFSCETCTAVLLSSVVVTRLVA